MTACVAPQSSLAVPESNINGSSVIKRPSGKNWGEVCAQVQKADGSVRTSPPVKSWQDVTNSPPRIISRGAGPFSHHLGKLGRPSERRSTPSERRSTGGSSRGGSSRGGSSQKSSGRSSGKFSRSSTPAGRDGDISSRCSSGVGDASTNSSGMSREGDTPRGEGTITTHDGVPSPSPSGSKGLLMPYPIRPLALLAGEDATQGEESAAPVASSSHEEDDACEMQDAQCYGMGDSTTVSSGSPSDVSAQAELTILTAVGPAVQLGLKLKRDPYGRDGPRKCQAKNEWSPEPLAKYLKGVVSQIDTNIQLNRLPTAEKLDAFVNRLVANTHRQLRHAPKKVRHTLNDLCARRFHRFWNFARNEKVRTTTPEELTSALLCIVEALQSEEVVGYSCRSLARRTLGEGYVRISRPEWSHPKPERWQHNSAEMCS